MFDGFSLWHLLILFLVVVLVFGSKKLASLGPDLGRALRGFKQAMHGETPEVQPTERDKAKDSEADAGKATASEESAAHKSESAS